MIELCGPRIRANTKFRPYNVQIAESANRTRARPRKSSDASDVRYQSERYRTETYVYPHQTLVCLTVKTSINMGLVTHSSMRQVPPDLKSVARNIDRVEDVSLEVWRHVDAIVEQRMGRCRNLWNANDLSDGCFVEI